MRAAKVFGLARVGSGATEAGQTENPDIFDGH